MLNVLSFFLDIDNPSLNYGPVMKYLKLACQLIYKGIKSEFLEKWILLHFRLQTDMLTAPSVESSLGRKATQ